MLRTIISGRVPLERTRRIISLRWVESNVSMFVLPNVGQTRPRTLLFWEGIFSIWEKVSAGALRSPPRSEGQQQQLSSPNGLTLVLAAPTLGVWKCN